MTKRLLAFRTLFLSLILFSYSCVDHQLPEIPPSLETLDTSPSGLKCQAKFNMNVVDIGDVPVVEYGMVVVGNNIGGNLNDIPTVGKDTKVIFDLPFSVGGKSKISNICSDRFFFRAYAILNDGTVIYGEVKSFIS